MYSTGLEIVTSYKAINLPYENNVSSLVSLVILFHSLSLCSWFLPLFILNSTSAWWKMNANWRSWKNTTKNLKSSVVGNFFFFCGQKQMSWAQSLFQPFAISGIYRNHTHWLQSAYFSIFYWWRFTLIEFLSCINTLKNWFKTNTYCP